MRLIETDGRRTHLDDAGRRRAEIPAVRLHEPVGYELTQQSAAQPREV
jgi:hypothetical protein